MLTKDKSASLTRPHSNQRDDHMTRSPLAFERALLASTVAVAMVFSSLPAFAQQQQAAERPFSLGLGLGAAASPGGRIGSLGLATIEFETPWRSAGVRFDATYMNSSGISGTRVTSLTSNLVYSHRIGAFAPYLIGGIGAYAQQGAGTSFGVNGGVGMKTFVGRLQPFIELREHVWSADRSHRATPFTIGIAF